MDTALSLWPTKTAPFRTSTLTRSAQHLHALFVPTWRATPRRAWCYIAMRAVITFTRTLLLMHAIRSFPHQFPGYPGDERDPYCQGFEPIQWSHQAPAGAKTLTSPSTFRRGFDTGDVFLVSEAGSVECLSLREGELKWTFYTPSGEPVRSTPSFSLLAGDDIVLFGAEDGVLYALDILTGTLLWSFQTSSPLRTSPVVDLAGNVFVIGISGEVSSIAADGTLLSTYHHSRPVRGEPAVNGRGELVFGDEAGVVNVLSFGCPADLLDNCAALCLGDYERSSSSCAANCQARC